MEIWKALEDARRLGNRNAIRFCARLSLDRILSQIPYEAAAGIRDVFAMQQRPQPRDITNNRTNSIKFP